MEQSLNNCCFCGNSLPFSQCCQPYLDNQAIPETPEQLMRSRYSAYVTKNADYLIATWHPDCHANNWREEIEQSFLQHNGFLFVSLVLLMLKIAMKVMWNFQLALLMKKLIINSLFMNVPVFCV